MRSNPPADDFVRARRWYHGTPSEAAAKKIMVEGVRPGDVVTAKQAGGFFKPVRGKVYMSAEPRYAIIYALGGDYAGFEPFTSVIEKDGRFGYLFVIDGAALADVQPDEDSVGEAAATALRMRPVEQGGYRGFSGADYSGAWSGFKTETGLRDRIARVAMSVTTEGRLRKACYGEVQYQAQLGKQMLRVLSAEDKLALIRMGAHVAHEGPALMPIESWIVDKMKSKELADKGFRQVFERVELAR